MISISRRCSIVVTFALLSACSTDGTVVDSAGPARPRQHALDVGTSRSADVEAGGEADASSSNDCVDADRDGYFTCSGELPADCDDTYEWTYPGADELCDGDDNNCDGQIDEVFENCDVPPGSRTQPRPPDEEPETPSGCTDDDNDGALHCPDQPDLHRDCDDTWAENRFGAYELCDGEDNDCDGQIDEEIINCDALPGSSRPDYPHPPREDRRPAPDCNDDDNDRNWYCETSTEFSTDCDPRRGDVFPGALDMPCDGVDQDCNGVIDDWGTECE
jgi:hypothetical protein